MPLVEFLDEFSLHRNARYNAGERAMVTDDEARDIVRQHAGFVVQDIRGYDVQPSELTQKALSNPPFHKQIKGAPVAKS